MVKLLFSDRNLSFTGPALGDCTQMSQRSLFAQYKFRTSQTDMNIGLFYLIVCLFAF